MADAGDLKSPVLTDVWVRFPPRLMHRYTWFSRVPLLLSSERCRSMSRPTQLTRPATEMLLNVTRYQLTDMTPRGHTAYARDLNSHGAVACKTFDSQMNPVSFVWHEGTILKLFPDDYLPHEPHAPNDDGVVVGTAVINEVHYACRWIDGECEFLDPPDDWTARLKLRDRVNVPFARPRPRGNLACQGTTCAATLCSTGSLVWHRYAAPGVWLSCVARRAWLICAAVDVLCGTGFQPVIPLDL